MGFVSNAAKSSNKGNPSKGKPNQCLYHCLYHGSIQKPWPSQDPCTKPEQKHDPYTRQLLILTWSLPQRRHLKQPTQSIILEIFRKWNLNSSWGGKERGFCFPKPTTVVQVQCKTSIWEACSEPLIDAFRKKSVHYYPGTTYSQAWENCGHRPACSR